MEADFLTNQANTLERFKTVLDIQQRILNIDPLNFETWKKPPESNSEGQGGLLRTKHLLHSKEKYCGQ